MVVVVTGAVVVVVVGSVVVVVVGRGSSGSPAPGDEGSPADCTPWVSKAATETTGWAGGRLPRDPKKSWFEKLKMPPSWPTIR